ncbi:amino acid adenylation domain-containing protein [Streptomyces sp. bgisy100]|uniref:amino acid adenylation domain-containing protein n=1 Tax=Streptomyces sp. bgisy100 TaxID=3413783 RepID=UPI003D74BE1F
MHNLPERENLQAVDRPGLPLSYTQESLWLLDRMSQTDGPAYNEPLAFLLTGAVDAGALGTALRDTVARHEALRTHAVETAEGLRAVVRDDAPDLLEVVDLRQSGTEEARSRGAELLSRHYRRRFDLAADLPLRALLVRLPGEESLLGLTFHHIATDAWSNGIVLDELGARYASQLGVAGRAVPAEPAVRFTDVARASREAWESGALAEKTGRWRDALESGPELLHLPLDRPRPPMQTFTGSGVTVSVPKPRIGSLLDVCRRECRSTEFSVLLAAYAALLHRYTGEEAVNIATTVLNRPDEVSLGAVGCFVNTAVLTLDTDPDTTFRQLLARADEAADRMIDDGDVPYPKVLDSLDIERDPSHNPVFQTMLTLLGRRPGLDLGPAVTAEPYRVTRAAAKFDLLLYVAEGDDHYELEAEFNTDLFDPGTVERMLRHYACLVEALASDIDTPIATVPFVPDDERRRILDAWNATTAEYPWSTVIDTIEEQVRRTPDAVAVEFEGRSLTYDGLNRRANQVARLLQARRAPASGPFVGVYMERSLEMVIALIAVVKAGCAYVPVDPEYPADRVAFMIEDAQLSLILTQEQHRAAVADSGAELLVLPGDAERSEDDSAPVRDLSPDSPVYMIYTSGSTGRPKGVVNRHVSLFNRLWWMQEAFGLTAEDRVLQKTPFSFDVSVWEFFWPLMFGARIVVARPGGHRDADYMKRVVHDRRITTVHFIPSILNVFLEEEELGAYCGSLRRVICSGEALPFKAVEKFTATLDCGLHNLYGPTEAAIDVSHWPCTPDYPGSVVPIGKPIANIRLYVMDRQQQLQPIGVPGELCIGGVGVAAGYHGRDELTRTVFLKDPYATGPEDRLYRTGDLARFLPDGQIQYMGRIDNQIKLRGVRIEPEEVTAALLETPSVKDAAVVLREVGKSRALVGYVVSAEFDQQVIRDHLAQRLPEFMLPQVIVEIPRIPTTPNGKLDRRALPAPFAQAPGEILPGTPPSTPEEHDVARVWREVLDPDELDVDANFFRSGGDSILSIRVVARLRELGYAAELRDVFARPTIRRLAETLTRQSGAAALPAVSPSALLDAEDRERLPRSAVDAWPLATLQSGMVFHTLLHEDSSVYHDIFDYEFVGTVRPELFEEAVHRVVEHRPQLRSTFDLENYREPLQIVHDRAAVPVGVTDVSGLDRDAQDRAVEAWVEEEKRRPFDFGRPLVRFRAHLRSADAMNVAISFHHAVLDGWSVALVLEELRQVYADLLDGHRPEPRPESVGYGHYVALERAAVNSPETARFWSELLAGRTPTALPGGPAGKSGPMRPATAGRTVDGPLEASLRACADRLGVPAKALYLAAHCTALSRLVGRTEVVSGLVTNGRPEVPGAEDLAGLFLNTLPFPVDTGEGHAIDLVRQVFEREQQLLPHRRRPLAETLRSSGTDALFDVVFNYTDFHVYASSDGGGRVRITGARYFELTDFPAVVHVHRDQFTGRMGLQVNYDAARVGTAVAERYLDTCLTALTSLASELRTADTAPAGGTRPERAERPAAPVPGGAVPTGSRPADAPPGGDPYGAATGMERRIAEIIAQAIGVTHVGIDENYLERGVDSITSIRILAKARKVSPGLRMSDVIGLRTVRELARRAEEAAEETPTAPATPLRPFELVGEPGSAFPAGVVDAYPVTALQWDMIRATEREPAQAAYHDVFSYELALPLDEAVLRRVLGPRVNAHETFRTAFARDGYAVPLQLVYEAVEPRLSVHDLEQPDGQEVFDAWFESEKGTGFDWSRPELIRFFAHRRGPDRFTLSLSFHHAIVDGWSLSLFVRDLVQAYAAALDGREEPLPVPPEVGYRDHVREELTARASEESRSYWRELLADHPGTDLPGFAPDGTGSRWSETRFVLDAGHRAALQDLAGRTGVPFKHLLLAGHLRTLALAVGSDDVVSGVFAHGRAGVEGGDRVLGMFLNFLPHRARFSGESWTDVVREVFEQDGRRLAHRRLPLAAIREELGRDQVFSALFNYTEFQAYAEVAGDAAGGGGGPVTGLRWFEHTDVPLLVNVGRDLRQEQVVVTLNADGRIVPQDVLELIARLYQAVLTSLAFHQDAPSTADSPETARLRDAVARRTARDEEENR